MKVILLDEIKGKGREGDVVDVARGYAVNYLLPRKLAVEATPGNVKQLEARRANIEKRETARKSDAESIAARLEGRRVTIEANAGEGGRLFGSVTGTMIEDAVLDQLDVDIDRKKLDIHGHIKTLGEHDIEARLHTDVRAHIVVVVVPAGGEAAAAPAPTVEEIIAAADEAEAAEAETAEAEVDEAETAEAGAETIAPSEAAMESIGEIAAEETAESAPEQGLEGEAAGPA